MLTKLRKRAKSIYWMIIVMFVGSIFAVWGMQYGSKYIETYVLVNNQPISRTDYEYTYERFYGIYKKIYGKNFTPEMIPNFRGKVLAELIKYKLLLPEAKKVGIDVLPEEIATAISLEFEDEQSYALYLRYAPASLIRIKEKLARQEISASKLESILFDSVLKASREEVFKFYQLSAQEAQISQILIRPEELIPIEELKKYYSKNKEDFKKPEDLHLKHILIKIPAEDKEAERRAREKAEDIYKKIKEEKVVFEDLAKQVSEDLKTKPYGGDLGTVSYEGLLEEVRGAVYALKEGEVSSPVRSREGWHIFKLVRRGEEKLREFEDKEVINTIKMILRDRYEGRAKKLADKVYKKLEKGGDFAELARKFSHGTTSYNGGYLGNVPKKFIFSDIPEVSRQLLKNEVAIEGTLIQDLLQAVFKLKRQHYTRPIHTPLGYHIIKLHKIYKADTTKFDQRYKEILNYYLQEKRDKLYKDWFDKLKRKARIKEFVRL